MAKVLIIAGGGVYGCIPAHFLAMLPSEEQNLLKVDLLSGCSIGGILALAYASGHTFHHVDATFQERASDCFRRRPITYLNPLAQPRYDASSLYNVIEDLIGADKVSDIRGYYPDLDVVVPSLDITEDAYKVFDNITGRDDAMPLTAVAAMTSAAPSYYKGVDDHGHAIVDGGLIEVAPLLTATTALKEKRGIPFGSMDVLMLGTGRDISPRKLTPARYAGLSLLGLATEVIVPYVTLSNEMATRYWGRNIGYRSFEYFNPCTTDGKLDNAGAVKDACTQAEQYKEQFLQAWRAWLNK